MVKKIIIGKPIKGYKYFTEKEMTWHEGITIIIRASDGWYFQARYEGDYIEVNGEKQTNIDDAVGNLELRISDCEPKYGDFLPKKKEIFSNV